MSSCSPVMQLDPKDHIALIKFLKKTFSDFYDFEEAIAPPLKRILDQVDVVGVSFDTTRTLMERADVLQEYFTDSSQKKVYDEIKLVLHTSQVILFTLTNDTSALFYSSVDELLEHYPEFKLVTDQQELQYLLAFRNFMKASLELMPAKANKIFLLRINERLEGSDQEYITGTGQKPAVSRRIQIYEQEGNVKAKTYKTGANAASVPNPSIDNHSVQKVAAEPAKEAKKRKQDGEKKKKDVKILLQSSFPKKKEQDLDELFDNSDNVQAHPLVGEEMLAHPEFREYSEAAEALINMYSSKPRASPIKMSAMHRELSEIPGVSLNNKDFAVIASQPYQGSFTEIAGLINYPSDSKRRKKQ